MKSLGLLITIVSVLVACPLLSPAQTVPAAASRIESVTVYRGQAMVARVVDLPGETGELEILIGDLPAAMVGGSLSASAEGGVTIRAVLYRARAADQAPPKNVAELDERIKDLRARLRTSEELQRTLLDHQKRYLENLLERFVSATAAVEMGKGVLNAETIAKTTEFIFARLDEAAKERVRLDREIEETKRQLTLEEQRRAEIAGGGDSTIREAVLSVSKGIAGPGTLKLSYLVNQADWWPTYNIRAAKDANTAQLEYMAHVQQTTGEDWSKVRMTLSTATPRMQAEGPPLVPFWVTLGEEAQAGQAALPVESYLAQRRQLEVAQQAAGVGIMAARGAGPGPTDQKASGLELNRLAAELQNLEMNIKEVSLRGRYPSIRPEEGGLSVSYQLPGAISLPSRPDRQLVEIAALRLPAQGYYEAVPLLSSFVYRKTVLTNTSELPLLDGPFSAYLDGEFVGQGSLPLMARGQEMTVGLGVDTQLRCRRDLIDKTDRIAWGSRVQTFTYRLSLENFKKAAVPMRVMDRIPASKTEDLTVSLDKTGLPLSTDPLYLRDLKPAGILRWDLELAAGAAGAQARQIEYTYQLKFAKDKHVGRSVSAIPGLIEQDYERFKGAKAK
jgi:prefoldin subunit 5